MATYEISIFNMTDDTEMNKVQHALSEAGVRGYDEDEIGVYLLNNKPRSVFVEPMDVDKAVEILNALGYETDEDKIEMETLYINHSTAYGDVYLATAAMMDEMDVEFGEGSNWRDDKLVREFTPEFVQQFYSDQSAYYEVDEALAQRIYDECIRRYEAGDIDPFQWDELYEELTA